MSNLVKARYEAKYSISRQLSPKLVVTFRDELLKPGETYLAIDCLNEWGKYVFDDNPKIKILYKSPPAVNTNVGHGDKPRNILYIFELAT